MWGEGITRDEEGEDADGHEDAGENNNAKADEDWDEDAGEGTDCVGAGGCGAIWGGVRGGVVGEGGAGDCEAGAVFERACGEFAEGVASGGKGVRGKFCAGRGAGGAFV